MSWTKLFPEKYPEVTSTLPDTVQYTTTVRHTESESFGHDFNLIRAVAEYGPQRVAEINKRLTAIETESCKLVEERAILDELIKVVKPAP